MDSCKKQQSLPFPYHKELSADILIHCFKKETLTLEKFTKLARLLQQGDEKRRLEIDRVTKSWQTNWLLPVLQKHTGENDYLTEQNYIWKLSISTWNTVTNKETHLAVFLTLCFPVYLQNHLSYKNLYSSTWILVWRAFSWKNKFSNLVTKSADIGKNAYQLNLWRDLKNSLSSWNLLRQG